MSRHDDSRLPDPVYGAANSWPQDGHHISVNYTKAKGGGRGLLHAHLGGMYLAMTERNWRALYAALSQLEVEEPPVRTVRISFNDAAGEAFAEVTE
jgi:hypothetical protein